MISGSEDGGIYKDALNEFNLIYRRGQWDVVRMIDKNEGPCLGSFGSEEEGLDFLFTQFRSLVVSQFLGEV